jgi:hypothetical protein
MPLPLDPDLSPRSAAEELGYTFLPCVLVGLSRAPQFVVGKGNSQLPQDIWANQVNAVVVPATACGGSALISFSQSPTKIIAVEDNQTSMQVPPESLGIKAIRVHSYLEALGVLVADRAGISANSLRPSLPSLNRLSISGKTASRSS